jgi:hypothetical protein
VGYGLLAMGLVLYLIMVACLALLAVCQWQLCAILRDEAARRGYAPTGNTETGNENLTDRSDYAAVPIVVKDIDPDEEDREAAELARERALATVPEVHWAAYARSVDHD